MIHIMKKLFMVRLFPKEIAVKIINEALKRDLHIQGYNDTKILCVRETEELRADMLRRTGFRIRSWQAQKEVVP